MSKKIIEKILNFKHKEIIFIVIIIVAIIITFVISSQSTNKVSKNEDEMSQTERLEYKIEQAVNAISGDDNCKVVLVWEKINDSSSNNGYGGLFQPVQSDVNVVKSVAVICKNGNDAKVKVNLTLMLCSLLDLESDRVFISGKN